jgi:hypothetical protein
MLHHYNSLHHTASNRHLELQQQQQFAIQSAAAAAVNKAAPLVRPYPIGVGAQYDPLYCWLQAAAVAQRADSAGFCTSPTGLFLPSSGWLPYILNFCYIHIQFAFLMLQSPLLNETLSFSC